MLKPDYSLLIARLDNLEGHIDSFDKTLNNHMTDYAKQQDSIAAKIAQLVNRFNWAFWVVFGLLTTVLAGLIAVAIVALQSLLDHVAQGG